MINISKSFYASLKTSSSTLSNADIIPIGDSPSEKKAANKLSMSNSLIEFENTPMPGFTLSERCIRYSAGEQMWKVIDPRGFKVEITSRNLDKILSVSGITEGLIQERCVWARNNSGINMELIPISSPLYIEALSNSELLENKVSMSDVNIGDRVYLQDKEEGIYLGTFTLYTQILPRDIIDNDIKNRALHRRQLIEIEPGKVIYSSNLKILKILEKAKTPITREESAADLNNRLSTNSVFFSSTGIFPTTYRSPDSAIEFISTTMARQSPKFSLKEITESEAEIEFHKAAPLSDCGSLVLEHSNGNQYMLNFPYYGSTTAFSTDHAPVLPIYTIDPENICLKRKTVIKYNSPVSYESFKNFTKFYKIVKHLKNETF